MAQPGKLILLTLSLLFAAFVGNGQAVTFGSTAELRAYGRPTSKGRFKAAANVVINNRLITYFWNVNCRQPDDSVRHIRPDGMAGGCYEAVTGPFIMAKDGVQRKGDTLSADSTIARKAALDSFKTAVGNWAQTMQTSSQAQTSNANLQFQIDNKANRTELDKYADTSMLKSAFGFIEGQVNDKADYDYVNAADQALRVQDSTDIENVNKKTDSVLFLVAGFPAKLDMYVKLSQFDAQNATTADLINAVQAQLANKIETETDPIYTAEKGQYLKKTDTTGKWQPKGSYQVSGNYQIAGDYALNSSLITKVNYFDTGLMLQPYLRTSTANGQFQPIGSYATTAALATKLDIQVADGKYLPITTSIPTVTDRVKYSDTSNMLNPYLRKNDTADKWLPKNTVIPSTAGFIKASDTASMLNPYARKAELGLSSISLPNVTVSENALVAIAAGWRNITVTCAGILSGDRVQINPTSAPAGYAIGQAVATANNTLVVQVWAPLLAIGASYSIPCKVTVFR